MLIKVFDKEHNPLFFTDKTFDVKEESLLDSGDGSLSFTYADKDNHIETEYYVETEDKEYVIKEIERKSDAFSSVVCALNLEELETNAMKAFAINDSTITDGARIILTGTGWTVGYCDVTKRRNAAMVNKTKLECLQALATAFMCDISFDTKRKKVNFHTELGKDVGAYFISGLNLRKITKKENSYDYYTQIIPLGKDGLTIESVNDGKDYLENYQYSDKVRVYVWEDTSYEDPSALMEDAMLKLADLSKPMVSYSLDISDLAAQSKEYEILEYALGDKVKIIDDATGTCDLQRIVKTVRYPDNPDKNTCEMSNAYLTFEEMQSKYKDAMEIIEYSIDGSGQYTGEITLSQIMGWENPSGSQGFSRAVTDLVTQIISGTLQTNHLDADEAVIGSLDVTGSLSANSFEADTLKTKYGEVEYLVGEELASHQATIDALDAEYAKIDLANIDKAYMNEWIAHFGLAEVLAVTESATIVSLNADMIKAGTILAERIALQGKDGLYYWINNDAGNIPASEVADPKYKQQLDGSVIVAKSITATEIAAKTIKATECDMENLQAAIAYIGKRDGTGRFLEITGEAINVCDAGGRVLATFGDTVTIGSEEDTHIVLNEDGLQIINGEAVLASYGETIVLGDENAGHVSVSDEGVYIYSEEGGEFSFYTGDFKITTIDGLDVMHEETIRVNSIESKDENVILRLSKTYPVGDGEKLISEAYVLEDSSVEDQGAYTKYSSRIYFAVKDERLSEENSALGFLSMESRYFLAKNEEAQDLIDSLLHVYVNDMILHGGSFRCIGLNANSVSCDNVLNLNGKGWNDGKAGIYAHRSGYMQIHRDSSDGNPYIQLARGTGTQNDQSEAVAMLQINASNDCALTTTKGIYLGPTGKVVAPTSNGDVNLGDSTHRWNEFSAKTMSIGAMTSWNNSGYGTYDQGDGQLNIRRSNGGTIRFWYGTTTANYTNLIGQNVAATRAVYLPSTGGTLALASSDVRIKENIEDTEVEALPIIEKIRLRKFDFTDKRTDAHREIGFIADELEEIDERFVLEGTGGYTEDGEMNIKCVDDFYMMGYAIKAIQELKAEVDRLKSELDALRKGDA